MEEHAPSTADALAERQAWQHRLLPLMKRMLIGLTTFFMLASLVQLAVLHNRINHAPKLDSQSLGVAHPESANSIEIGRMTLAARLEADVVARRYHQANIAMMSRVWVHYLGFVTGMIISLMGSTFILAKVTTTPSEIAANAGPSGGSLRTASPGIVLCALGVVLMITTIVVHHEIETIDAPTYFKTDPKPNDALPDKLTRPASGEKP